MADFQTINPAYNLGTQMPVNTQTQTQRPVQNAVMPTVQTQNPPVSSIYNYPTSSVYDTNQKQMSGVNIYIYNPSAIGGQGAPVVASAPMQPQSPVINNTQYNGVQDKSAVASQPIASSPLETAAKKTKQVTELTDNYIKTLESYLKSADKYLRKTGINELIKRYEEDDSRYKDKALTALLNIALQDPDENNRMLAMSPIAGGSAHGDENTVNLLQRLQQSDKLFGEEAKMASDSLLKASEEKTEIPDNSPAKPEQN